MRMRRSLRCAVLGLCLALAVGCGQPRTPESKPDGKGSAKGDHGHAHGAGPHGGTVVDWGRRYHVEFCVDHNKQEATVYVLKGDAQTAAPIKADKLLLTIKEPSFQVELMPQPQEKDAEGTSSRFMGNHEKLGKEQEFAGTISGTVDGKPYAADFKEEPEEKK